MATTKLRLPCKPDRADRICSIITGNKVVDTFDAKISPATRFARLGTLGEDRPIYIQYHIPERPAVKDPADFLLTLETTETLDINRSKAETFGPYWSVPLATYGFTLEPNGDWRLFIPESELSPDSCLLYITLHPIV